MPPRTETSAETPIGREVLRAFPEPFHRGSTSWTALTSRDGGLSLLTPCLTQPTFQKLTIQSAL